MKPSSELKMEEKVANMRLSHIGETNATPMPRIMAMHMRPSRPMCGSVGFMKLRERCFVRVNQVRRWERALR